MVATVEQIVVRGKVTKKGFDGVEISELSSDSTEVGLPEKLHYRLSEFLMARVGAISEGELLEINVVRNPHGKWNLKSGRKIV